MQRDGTLWEPDRALRKTVRALGIAEEHDHAVASIRELVAEAERMFRAGCGRGDLVERISEIEELMCPIVYAIGLGARTSKTVENIGWACVGGRFSSWEGLGHSFDFDWEGNRVLHNGTDLKDATPLIDHYRVTVESYAEALIWYALALAAVVREDWVRFAGLMIVPKESFAPHIFGLTHASRAVDMAAYLPGIGDLTRDGFPAFIPGSDESFLLGRIYPCLARVLGSHVHRGIGFEEALDEFELAAAYWYVDWKGAETEEFVIAERLGVFGGILRDVIPHGRLMRAHQRRLDLFRKILWFSIDVWPPRRLLRDRDRWAARDTAVKTFSKLNDQACGYE